MTAYLKNLKSEAYDIILSGGNVPGWKVDTVTGDREWEHPDTIAAELARLAKTKADTFQNVKVTPKGVIEGSKIAKMHGVPASAINALIIQPKKRGLMKDDGTQNVDPGGFRFGKIE
jgi:hypothetical protein